MAISYKKVAHARDPQADPCGHLALCFSPVKQTDYCNIYHTILFLMATSYTIYISHNTVNGNIV